MRRNPGSSFRNLGPYSSPGTPEHCDVNSVRDIIPPNWSSERVPLSMNSRSKRYTNAAALIPFNNGRALPSKWDDAERWITSPISSQTTFKNSTAPAETQVQAQVHHRQPFYLPTYPPSKPVLEDDELDHDTNGEEAGVLHRDMATQISPSQGTCPSFSSISSPFLENPHTKDDVRDVQEDKGTTSTLRQSRRLGVRKTRSTNNTEEIPSSLNAREATRDASRLQLEEAKIIAWENLQKAKAEAAIQKLEMKLEKKRLASMDQVMNKLRSAQTKAQRPAPTNSHKRGFSFCIFTRISNCFACNKT